MGSLADVDDILDAGMASVVDAVCEEHDEVSSSSARLRCVAEFVAAGDVEGIEYGGATYAAVEAVDGCVDSGEEIVAVAGPILFDELFEVEAHDEGFIGVLAQDVGAEVGGDLQITAQVPAHGTAGVDENACADLPVGAVLEGEDAFRFFAVVEQVQIGDLKIIDGKSVFIDGIESEVYLGNVYRKGIDGVWRWRIVLCDAGQRRDGEQGELRGSQSRGALPGTILFVSFRYVCKGAVVLDGGGRSWWRVFLWCWR